MTYHPHRPAIKRHTRAWIMASILTASLLVSTVGYVAAGPNDTVTATGLTPSTVYINEIKSGGNNTTVPQYVTIYNAGDSNISLSGWTAEYAKQAFLPASCALSNWKLNGGSNVASVPLTGTLAAHTVSQPFALTINDNDPGSVHITDDAGVIRDTVGWGGDTASAPCYETAQAAQLTATKSLQRYLGCISSLPTDTDDNASDFVISSTPRPSLAGTITAPQCTPAPTIPVTPTDAPQPVTIPASRA